MPRTKNMPEEIVAKLITRRSFMPLFAGMRLRQVIAQAECGTFVPMSGSPWPLQIPTFKNGVKRWHRQSRWLRCLALLRV